MDDGTEPIKPPPRKRKRDVSDKDTMWIKDDTLPSDSSEEINKPSIFLNIHISNKDDEEEEEEDEDYQEDDDQPDFIEYLMDKYVGNKGRSGPQTRSQVKSANLAKKEEKIPITLTKKELVYYKSQSESKRSELFGLMKRMSSLTMTEGEVPHKFKVLELPVSDYVKSTVIKKITAVEEMGAETGEAYKLRTWIDAFLRIPFGKIVPLPVKIEDGRQKCTEFMVEARKSMDSSIYGMVPAKTQIMQILAQLLVNPNSVGNVIALQGPMGVGKTSLARNAIANVMKRPFEFFSLGGASDIANFGRTFVYL
jgi:ATP-dependent Lon protease